MRATRSVAEISRSTGPNPARAIATPTTAASTTPIPPTTTSTIASRESVRRVGSSSWASTSARPDPACTATTRYGAPPTKPVRGGCGVPAATATSGAPTGGSLPWMNSARPFADTIATRKSPAASASEETTLNSSDGSARPLEDAAVARSTRLWSSWS